MIKSKIVFLDHLPFIGGAQLVLADHLKSLDKDRFAPTVVIDENSTHAALFEIDQVEVLKIPFSQLKTPTPLALKNLYRSVKSLNSLLDQISPDLLISNTNRGYVLLGLASSKAPKIAFIRDYDYPKIFFKLFEKKYSLITFVSKDVQTFYGSPKNSQVIYVPTDMIDKLGAIKPNDVTNFRRGYQLAPEDKVIGFIGRLVDWKGAQTVIEAIEKLERRDIKALIVGTGAGQKNSVEQSLQGYVATHQLTDRVKFAGFTQNTPLVYKSIDIFVLPSNKPEPFATTMVEAAQAQLPIIATGIGGTSEFIIEKQTGLLFEPNSSQQLADSIQFLIANPNLKNELAKNAFEKSQTFTNEKITRQLENLYNDILKTRV